MCKHKVAITGFGAVSPFGWGSSALLNGLEAGLCALSLLDPGDAIVGMRAQLGGKAPDFNLKTIPREYRRAMPRCAIMAFAAACEALQTAKIEPCLPLSAKFSDMGIAIGGTLGSSIALDEFFSVFLPQRSVESVRGANFFKIMAHSAPSNLAVAFGLTGRCLAPGGACAAGLQAVGLAFEAIAAGYEKAMLCGGTEEFHSLLPATFDRLGAASLSADPQEASRPFDLKRNGIVCSEGAGILLLENMESAMARGAEVLGEVLGYAANTSPTSIITPDSHAIGRCMAKALEMSGLKPEDIALVNAHATATDSGDIAEGKAIHELFGSNTPVNSLKGYLGHTMAASGSLELGAVLLAANKNLLLPTRNLHEPDPACGNLLLPVKTEHFDDAGAERLNGRRAVRILKNSFGLGGVNSSIVINAYI